MNDLVFMMGEYPASLPVDRQYARNHMWSLPTADGVRFGFTAYAERMLRDVYFLEWSVDTDTLLATGQPIGEIESKKAESALYAPVDGRLLQFNETLLYDPAGINKDVYGNGWLFEMDMTSGELLDAAGYVRHLESVWKLTQRIVKDDACKLI